MAVLLHRLSDWVHSLQAQLLLWAILPVTLVVIGLSLTGVYTHQQAMRDFVTQRDQLLAQVLAMDLAAGVRRGDIVPDSEGVAAWLPVSAEDIPGSVFVVDSGGKVLASSDALSMDTIAGTPWGQDVFAQPEGAVVIEDTGEGTAIVTFATAAGTGWRVVVRSQVAELLGPVLRFSSLGPIAAAAAGGLSLLILTFGWRTIARPLQQLSAAASAVSWGNHAPIQQEILGVSEIEELHRAITDMVERLESYQAGVLDYLDALSKGQEEERARLAHEIHDGPVQSLIALIQRTERVDQKVTQGNLEDAQVLLGQLREAEVTVVEDLRRIIGALRPAYLEDLGFVPALEMLVRSANDRSRAEVHLVVENAGRLDPETELAAYRIAQEALNNALQHANASHVTVTVRYDREGLFLQVTDDGKGFVPAGRLDAYTRQGHFGLVGLQERARQLGGSLHVQSAPGQGTVVSVRLSAHAPPSAS